MKNLFAIFALFVWLPLGLHASSQSFDEQAPKSPSLAQTESLSNLADSAYNSGDFAMAATLYHQAEQINGTSPLLYYNLGNTYYRLGQLGKAVIYYERALQLDPSMEDARANLNFVNTKIIDKPEDDSTFLGNLHNSIRSIMSPNAWAWIAFSLFTLMLVCVAIYVFANNLALRKTGFFGAFILLFLFLYGLAIAWGIANASYEHYRAVIVVPTSNLSTTPGGTGDNSKIIPVHEGTVVEIVDSMAIPGDPLEPKWYDVKINNSTRAWVKSSEVEKI